MSTCNPRLANSLPLMTSRLAWFIATLGGSGHFPVAPGTVGSVVSAALAWFVIQATGAPTWTCGVAAVVFFYPAVWAAGKLEADSGEKDPGRVVVDEAIGQWLTLTFARPDAVVDWVLAVALFRIFDILKPPPIRSLEKIPGGLGVVADDAAAGACAMIILAVARLAGLLA